jgi:signal transduction histidine kinase
MHHLATTQTPADRDEVEHQLMLSFISNAKAGINSAIFSTPVVVVVLAGHVHSWALALWASLIMAIAVYRHRLIVFFTKNFSARPSPQAEQYLSRRAWTWAAMSALWSGVTFLYLDQVPLANQFLCLLILVGTGVLAVGLMPARMDCFHAYIYGMLVTVTLAIVWRLTQTQGSYVFLWGLLGLAYICAWLVLAMGERSHQLLRRSLELRNTNNRLIESLMAQTRAANEAVQVKNRLLAQAAHDLRQPVHALAFYADWLRGEPQLSHEVIPKILQCTDSVHALFDSLFDFARLDAGALSPRMQTVDVRDLVNQVVLPLEHTAAAKGLHIRTRVHAVQVRSDAILLRRVVSNLVSNAVRYTERGGILIGTRRRGEHLWLEVWDTGIGIAPADQTKVFDEFYKVRRHGGTEEGFGLGLAIVRRLSSLMTVGLHLQSRPGRGTCVRLELPRERRELSTAAPLGVDSVPAQLTNKGPKGTVPFAAGLK